MIKKVFITSLFLNVALAVFILSRKAPPELQPIINKAPVARPFRHAKVSSAPKPVEAKPHPFDWSQIETNNYFAYVANLRAVGCPEKTIQDMLIADLEKLYNGRIDVPKVPVKFWRTSSEERTLQNKERARRLALKKELRQLIYSLLGIDWSSESHREYAKNGFEMDIVLGVLSDEKKFKLMDIFSRFQDEKYESLSATFDIPLDEDKAMLREAGLSLQSSLQNLLSPWEFEESSLRLISAFSDNGIIGLDLTGAEYRQIVQIKMPRNMIADFFITKLDDSPDERETGALKLKEDVAIKQLLGEKRFQDYQRAGDSDFQRVYQETKNDQIPVASVVRVYDLRKAGAEEASRLRADKNLSDEELSVALSKTVKEVQKAVITVLGSKVGAKYIKSSNWNKEGGEVE